MLENSFIDETILLSIMSIPKTTSSLLKELYCVYRSFKSVKEM